MVDESVLTCFASFHWDDDPQRAFLKRVSAACEGHGVTLQFEAFDLGLHVPTRMETIVFDSFVFLCTPAAWASPGCQAELRTARTRHVPVITVRLRGDVPAELMDRVFLDAEDLRGPEEASALDALAATVATRARLHRRIGALDADDSNEQWRRAERLFEEVDRTLLAESAQHLALFYRPDVPPATRYWLALALGKAGTAETGAILDRFTWETHPYPLRGIRHARQMMGGQQSERRDP